MKLLTSLTITIARPGITTPEYKSNLLLEFWKLSEMLGDVQQQREFRRQYEEMLRVTTTFSAPSKSNPVILNTRLKESGNEQRRG